MAWGCRGAADVEAKGRPEFGCPDVGCVAIEADGAGKGFWPEEVDREEEGLKKVEPPKEAGRVDWRKGFGVDPPPGAAGETSGRLESMEAPKRLVGLKGATEEPENPVGWACRGAWEGVRPREAKGDVFVEFDEDVRPDVVLEPAEAGRCTANSEARLDIRPAPVLAPPF